jgi:hypothetical protein
MDWLMEKALAFTSEVGSRRIVWAALSHQNQPAKLRGEYVSSFDIQEVSDVVLSPEGIKVQDRSWFVICRLKIPISQLISRFQGRAGGYIGQGRPKSQHHHRPISFARHFNVK